MHGLNLKYYLMQGLKLVKIHRGIKFYQEAFIKPYIDFCTRMRREAKTEAAKNIWKLLANSLYGKMIEGVSKRMDCRFNRTREQALRNTASPLFKSNVICDENFSISFLAKSTYIMKQSWAIGFSILELSKLHMQRLYYDRVQPALDYRCTVLMSDTDSWLLCTDEMTADEAVCKILPVMDCSNYKRDHPLYSADNAKRVGYLKNELPGKVIDEFVGLKSKTYALKIQGEQKAKIRAKGVSGPYKEKIPFEAMKSCLEEQKGHDVTHVGIEAKNHVNRLVQSTKVAFSSFDDKRYLTCPVHSVPYGSWVIENVKDTGRCYFCAIPSLRV